MEVRREGALVRLKGINSTKKTPGAGVEPGEGRQKGHSEAHRSPLCSGSHPAAPGRLQEPRPLATALGHVAAPWAPGLGVLLPPFPLLTGQDPSLGPPRQGCPEHHGPKAPQKSISGPVS